MWHSLLGMKDGPLSRFLSTFLLKMVPLMFLLATAEPLAQTPPFCEGSGIGVALLASPSVAEVGDRVVYDVEVTNTVPGTCDASDVRVTIELPDGRALENKTLRELAAYSASVQFRDGIGASLRALPESVWDTHPSLTENRLDFGTAIRFSDIRFNQELEPPSNEERLANPLVDLYVIRSEDVLEGEEDSRGTARALVNARIEHSASASRGGGQQPVSFTVREPGLRVTLECVDTPEGPETVRYTGRVENTGTTPLSEVGAVVEVAGQTFPVLEDLTLATGQGVAFTTDVLARNPCAESQALVRARASGPPKEPVHVIGQVQPVNTQTVLERTASAQCPAQAQPGLELEVTCADGPARADRILSYTGTVINTGQIALTQVRLINPTLPGQVRFDGGENSVARLAPGDSVAFTYLAAASKAGPACGLRTTFSAQGLSPCTETPVASAPKTLECPLPSNAAVSLNGACPDRPVPPGSVLVTQGSVTNTGGTVLTHVVVTRTDVLVSGTFPLLPSGPPLLRRPLDPTVVAQFPVLRPGETRTFTARLKVEPNCCATRQTLRVKAKDTCGGEIQDHRTLLCPVATNPALQLTRECPKEPITLGEPLPYSGTVRNAGDITLTDVVVYDSVQGLGKVLLGPIALAPGETRTFEASDEASVVRCEGTLLVAQGQSLCGQQRARTELALNCPVLATPRIELMTLCPKDPLVPGTEATFSGLVRNTGESLIRDFKARSEFFLFTTLLGSVQVADSGPVDLPPGAEHRFDFTFTPPAEVGECCELVVQLVGQGKDTCSGASVSASATAVCPLENRADIGVRLDCPSELALAVGGEIRYTGELINSGNLTLTDVRVRANREDSEQEVVDSFTLAPGEVERFEFFMAGTDSSAPVVVTATGTDSCDQATVTTTAECEARRETAGRRASVSVDAGWVRLRWSTQPGGVYRVQACDHLGDSRWTDVGEVFVADGPQSEWSQAMDGEDCRFFRLVRVR